MPLRLGHRSSQLHAPKGQCLRSTRGGSNGRKAASQVRDFSQSTSQPFRASCRQETRLRREMFAWLNGPGRVFKEPLPSSTNYLGAYDKTGQLKRVMNTGQEEGAKEQAEEKTDEEIAEEEEGLDEAEKQVRREARRAEEAEARNAQLPPERGSDFMVFPLNRQFKSQSVLSEELREELWRQVVVEKRDVATTSAVFGVDMRRVAAVVRLKTIEKQWVEQGKKLATPYASAVLDMLPKTTWAPGSRKNTPHESINDLPVHPWTRQQIFYPTSESRHFTREDAAKVFSPTLLPADERIPHPDLVKLERDAANEGSRQKRQQAQMERDAQALKERTEKEQRQAAWEAKNVRKVEGQRWDFTFTNINVDAAGKDGRGKGGVGWRYGNPHNDRKRGMVKIPTSVE